ncbi:proteinase-activated receptor 1-like [Centropristis striata]|uniref:proteinase-activated receptor 1-like n=1 Tax=Centropristis striata TaxID=184440 RepID=UPI0027E06695|nr:proteinase-activated receptor 1-like [Centropristis striata]
MEHFKFNLTAPDNQSISTFDFRPIVQSFVFSPSEYAFPDNDNIENVPDYHINFTNFTNFTNFSTDHHVKNGDTSFVMFVATCVIVCLSLPLTLWAIAALYSLVRKDQVAPIYVINLLISDLVQFCYMIVEVAAPEKKNLLKLFMYIYDYSVLVSVGFMVVIALERYLAVVHPLWYRFRRTNKTCVLICVLVWILPVVPVLTECFCDRFQVVGTILGVFFLLPLPLLMFFLIATLKALYASTLVPSEEKRRITGMLVLVLLIYLSLFLPAIIALLTQERNNSHILTAEYLAPMFLKLSPLADLFLYVFLRKGATNKCPACMCCWRADSSELSSITT